jgi:7-cyano-7-deazaguanine synthase
MPKKALVLLSGGIDSSAVLWWVKRRGWTPATLSFDFAGRKKQEVRAIRALRRASGSRENFDLPLSFVDRPQPGRSGYIPQRNLIYYSIAAALAEKIGADYILGGHIGHDRRLFADATAKFLGELDRMIRLGAKGRKPRLIFPFIRSGKGEVVRTGARCGVPFQHTWSCSYDGPRHCWECYSCGERREGFRAAGLKDPLDSKEI